MTDPFPFLLLLNPAIPKAVNLVIFFGILYYLLRKPAREFYQERFNEIRASLQKAAREKEQATARMAELDQRLNRLDTELAGIRQQSQQEAAAERERVAVQAREEADKIRQTATREINSAKNAALLELRQFTAARSVEMAEQIIRREMSAEDDSRLVGRISDEIQKATQAAK
ncbi:MAG: hypothetical protein ACKV2V_09865 [Blastocatellia bacterium]